MNGTQAGVKTMENASSDAALEALREQGFH